MNADEPKFWPVVRSIAYGVIVLLGACSGKGDPTRLVRYADDYAEIDIAEDAQPKCAAVLIPLLQEGHEWHVLYTRRTQGVQSHKGQVSFPGGRCDTGESNPEQTALREAYEEAHRAGKVSHLGLSGPPMSPNWRPPALHCP